MKVSDIFLGESDFPSKGMQRIRMVINILCLVIIVASICTSLFINSMGISLWLDEAMLAFSFSQRSFGELTSTLFEWNQAAPALYLYIVKTITLIFGNSEITLRLWSLITYVLTLGFSYYILKNITKVKIPLLPVAFLASLTIMLRYSYEFKPYMSDCAVALFTIIVYYKHSRNELNQYIAILIFAILIWMSNPVCFVIGGILLYDFVDSILKKDYARLKFTIICGIAVLASFAGYFFYWLKPVIDAGEMADFWEGRDFPLLPLTAEERYHQRFLLRDLVRHFGFFKFVIFFTIVGGVVVNFIWTKNKVVSIILISFAITLFASGLGMFPLQERMSLFLFPLMTIVFFYFVDKLYSKKFIPNILVTIFLLVVLFSTRGLVFYSDMENVYMEESDRAVEFIEHEIKDGETLFVSHSTRPAYTYVKEYDLSGLNYNVILQSSLYGKKDGEKELQQIIDAAPTYLFVTRKQEYIGDFIQRLEEKGNMKLVYDKYGSFVYYYTNIE